MAFTPCAADGAMYKGGANTAFLRLVNGASQLGGKRQFCSRHSPEVHEYLDEHAQLISVGDEFKSRPEEAEYCMVCGGNPALGWQLYAGTYFRGEQECQYYGLICNSCVSEVAEALYIGG